MTDSVFSPPQSTVQGSYDPGFTRPSLRGSRVSLQVKVGTTVHPGHQSMILEDQGVTWILIFLCPWVSTLQVGLYAQGHTSQTSRTTTPRHYCQVPGRTPDRESSTSHLVTPETSSSTHTHTWRLDKGPGGRDSHERNEATVSTLLPGATETLPSGLTKYRKDPAQTVPRVPDRPIPTPTTLICPQTRQIQAGNTIKSS